LVETELAGCGICRRLAVDAAPLGIQLLGRWQGDGRLTAAARWLAEVQYATTPKTVAPALLALEDN